jgi:hypothetical protein
MKQALKVAVQGCIERRRGAEPSALESILRQDKAIIWVCLGQPLKKKAVAPPGQLL